MKRFRDQLLCGALGLLGVAAPAALIDHATFGISGGTVIVGVLIASFVGYGFGAWSVSRAYRDEQEEEEEEEKAPTEPRGQ